MAEIKKIQPIGSSVQYDLDALHVLYEGGRISSPSAMKADSKLHIYLSTSSMTTDKPPIGDGHILHFAWDNTGGWDNELAIGSNGHLSVRGGQGSGNTTNSTQSYTNWNTILDSANYTSYTVKKDGTGATGDWGINITGNAATASSIAWSGITGKPNRAGSDSDGGPAQTVKGTYTSNGGQQNPNYFGKNKVGFLMMNTTVNSNSQYKDWIIMDCYSGSDVGGGVAFGVNRQSLGAYIMRSAAARETWAESAELIGTHNYTTYTVKKDGTGATGTWSISISGNAATATALTSSAGSSTVPIYFSSGKPVQCSTTLGVSITGSAASATKASQDGDGNVITSTYVKKTGDTLTGNLLGNAANSLGSEAAPFHNIILGGVTSATMTAASTNPRITFQENTGTQPVHLIYTDYDNYRSPAGPAGLKVIGGSSATPAWFEVEGTVYAAGFNGPLTGNVTGNVSGSSASCTGNAATATKLSNTPNNTTTFLRGDNTWSNELTGNLNFSDANIGIRRVGRSTSWIAGRDGALLRTTSISGYSPAISIKTTNGSWEIGAYNTSSYYDDLIFSYHTDTNYNAGTNNTTAQLRFYENGHILGTLDGNASTATKLATARSLKTKLDSTTAVTFDGSAAQDAIPVTGTLGVANGGTGTTTLTSGAALIGNGTGAVTTRSIRNNTSVGALGWTAQSTDITLVTTNTIAYWDGAYSGTTSNLQYYKGGAFGTMAKETATDYAKKSELLDLIYPIGAIYISATSTSPATLFGGTWEQIEGKFLLASDTNHEAGTTGGSETVTLTTAEMPAHTHNGPSHTHTGPSHTHSGPSHTHNLSSHYHWVGPQNGGANGAGWHVHGSWASRVHTPNAGNKQVQSGSGVRVDWDQSTFGAGDHTHSVWTNAVNSGGPSNNTSGAAGTGATGAAGTGATGASGTGATSSTGSGGAHNNMPPYLSVYVWQRTA